MNSVKTVGAVALFVAAFVVAAFLGRELGANQTGSEPGGNITLRDAMEFDRIYGGVYVVLDSSTVRSTLATAAGGSTYKFMLGQGMVARVYYRPGERDIFKEGINIVVLKALLEKSE